jgi:hypothetical protein
MKKKKRKVNQKTTMSEASRRPPPHLFVLTDKGEKYRLKLEGSTQFVLLSVLSGKTGLSDFAQQNFYLSFVFPNSRGLENYVMCERLCVKACNTYLNLNYACFLCHDIL